MSAEENDTQPAIEVAPVNDPPSWHGPVRALDTRVTKLEAAAVVVQSKLDSIEKKTDEQTLILARLDKVASNPWVRAIFAAIALAFCAWLSRHGMKVEIPQ
jgi:hypothetical protein